jgi:hypothetical protein
VSDPTTPVPTPIIVNPSAIPAQVATIARDVGVVIGALTAIGGFVQKRDLQGLLTFLQDNAFVSALGLVLTAGILVYRQWSTRRTNAKLKTLEPYAPSEVATLKGQV